MNRTPETGPAIHHLSCFSADGKTCTCSVCGPYSKVYTAQGKRHCYTRRLEGKRRRIARRGAERAEKKRVWLLDHTSGTWGDWRRFAKPICQKCGFVAVHMDQIDVHHIDRNKKNGHVSNLLSLCANCHRLEHVNDLGRSKKAG